MKQSGREQIANQLVTCAYVERATAHVLLGWLPLVPDIDHKLVLGDHAWVTIARASRLERYVQSISRIRGGHRLAVPRAWRTHMKAIDASPNANAMLRQLYLVVRAALVNRYRAALAAADPLRDAALVEILAPALRDTDAHVKWARRVLRAPARGGAKWLANPRGPLLARTEWLWPPLARVPRPARPPELASHDEEGALVIPIVKPGMRTAAAMLHENVDAEITTMELFARCSYEHPDMPEAFHQNMARQASDESRHARACLDLAEAYGMPHGTFPTSTDVYDFHYQFKPCPPGSRRELLWRLLLRSTFQEALSLDGFVPLSARLAHDKAHAAARVLESLMADEVFHVESGLKWARYLCDGDDDRVFRERDAAHRYYVQSAQRARKQYVKANPDRAIAETEQLWKLHQQAHQRYPFDLRVYLARTARESIGFSERDLEQIVNWGYAND